jgi:hypothetical protein
MASDDGFWPKVWLTLFAALFGIAGALLSRFGVLDSDAHASQLGMAIAGVVCTCIAVILSALTDFEL